MMTDERLIERTCEFLEEQTEARIRAITSSVPRGRIGAVLCLECDGKIPEARRLAGYSRCVECVSDDEAWARRFRL